MRCTTPGAATITVAALCISLAAPLRAQVTQADTTDEAAAVVRARSRLSITANARSYRVGDSTLTERVGTARYDLYASRVHLRVDGSLLRFQARPATIQGSLPIAGRINFAWRPGDTISVFARTSSRPAVLTQSETSALSVGGTSVLDLESSGLGTPALFGARVALAFPLGDMVLATRAGLEGEPAPSGTLPVYWRGTTVRGGLSLTTSMGEGSFTAALDASRSSADSLGGRNLFPGGGSVTLQLMGDFSVRNPFDILEDERWPVSAIAFYGRPVGSRRNDQPNLLIPQGDLVGAMLSMLVPRGDLLFSPSVQVLRESSESQTGTALQRSSLSSYAWTIQSGVDVSIPLGDVFELTPQASYVFGRVGATSAQTTLLRRGRGIVQSSSFSDGIRGYWLSLQLSASI